MPKGWGKAVPLPKNPVYVPPELMNLLLPPPPSGLPFNAQLHKRDIERGYIVPTYYPQPLLAELGSEAEHNADLRAVKEAHEEFMSVLKRSTVRVVPPADQAMLERIHKTIEYVIKEGPVFEAIIIARENRNPDYRFLSDNKGHEHIYYRWKLFSILNGDDLYEWRTDEFRMFEDGPLWRPPPLNPFADGMPEELIDYQLSCPKEGHRNSTTTTTSTSLLGYNTNHNNNQIKGTLGSVKREILIDLLQNLEPTKAKIGASMMFCIDHADAAREIIDHIIESLRNLDIPLNKKLARLFLISDILNNCSAAVTNASYYREGFQTKLVHIFECLRKYLLNIGDNYEADRFKHKILSVLGAWKEWTLYENEFLISLSNILLGIETSNSRVVPPLSEIKLPDDDQPKQQQPDSSSSSRDTDLDGVEVDEETLSRCLETKGLSLRWYMTLELSEDEAEADDDDYRGYEQQPVDSDVRRATSTGATGANSSSNSSNQIKFKSSKWETLDPNEVAGQAVTISKWEAMAKVEEDGVTDSSASSSASAAAHDADRDERRGFTDSAEHEDYRSSTKRLKLNDGNCTSTDDDT